MRIPRIHSKREQRKKRTALDLLIQVVIPGLAVLYLVRTEGSYLAMFTDAHTALQSAEVILLSLHLIFTNVLLPLVWVFSTVHFFSRGGHARGIITAISRSSATVLFWLLLVAILLRIIATI